MHRSMRLWSLMGLVLVASACEPSPSFPARETAAPVTIEPAWSIYEASPWLGSPTVAAVDGTGVLGPNVRGLHLDFQTLWAVRSTPGTLLRLIWNGTNVTPDSASGWNVER